MGNLLEQAIRGTVQLDAIILDTIITAHYGVEYNVTESLYEPSQDSVHSIDLFETLEELEEKWDYWYDDGSPREKMELWLAGGESPHPSIILTNLHAQGLIPKARYEIYVWW